MFQLHIANTCFNEVSLQSALGKYMHENIRPGSNHNWVYFILAGIFLGLN